MYQHYETLSNYFAMHTVVYIACSRESHTHTHLKEPEKNTARSLNIAATSVDAFVADVTFACAY